MDRFIVYSFGIPSAKITDLKSNMDRFIVEPFCQTFALNVI